MKEHKERKSEAQAIRERSDAAPHPIFDLQRLAGNAAVAELYEPDLSVLSSGSGRPLDEDVRADMESRFGADFSDVRIHTGLQANLSAQSVDAHAYTVGSNIVFSDGAYNHASDDGRHTLAHELTHVLQQRSGPVDGTAIARGDVSISDPDDRHEREAADISATIPAPMTALGQPTDRRILTRTIQRVEQREARRPPNAANDTVDAVDAALKLLEDLYPGLHGYEAEVGELRTVLIAFKSQTASEMPQTQVGSVTQRNEIGESFEKVVKACAATLALTYKYGIAKLFGQIEAFEARGGELESTEMSEGFLRGAAYLIAAKDAVIMIQTLRDPTARGEDKLEAVMNAVVSGAGLKVPVAGAAFAWLRLEYQMIKEVAKGYGLMNAIDYAHALSVVKTTIDQLVAGLHLPDTDVAASGQAQVLLEVLSSWLVECEPYVPYDTQPDSTGQFEARRPAALKVVAEQCVGYLPWKDVDLSDQDTVRQIPAITRQLLDTLRWIEREWLQICTHEKDLIESRGRAKRQEAS